MPAIGRQLLAQPSVVRSDPAVSEDPLVFARDENGDLGRSRLPEPLEMLRLERHPEALLRGTAEAPA